MFNFDSLPEGSARRLLKVIVRTIHLVGIAGVFGSAMSDTTNPFYLYLAMISGVVLMIMEIHSGLIWFVQLRGIAQLVKMLFLLVIHQRPELTMSCLIVVIVISGLMSHAPSWIRYFSLQHGKVVHSNNDQLG